MPAIVYLTLDEFKLRTVMPPEEVVEIEARYPGYVEKRLARNVAEINSVLAKRYAVPFTAGDVPEIVLGWLVDMTTLDAYGRRGWNATSEQDKASIQDPADRARAQMQAAADAENGLYELPLKESAPGASGVSKGGPYGYAEASPYTFMDRQSEARDAGGER